MGVIDRSPKISLLGFLFSKFCEFNFYGIIIRLACRLLKVRIIKTNIITDVLVWCEGQ